MLEKINFVACWTDSSLFAFPFRVHWLVFIFIYIKCYIMTYLIWFYLQQAYLMTSAQKLRSITTLEYTEIVHFCLRNVDFIRPTDSSFKYFTKIFQFFKNIFHCNLVWQIRKMPGYGSSNPLDYSLYQPKKNSKMIGSENIEYRIHHSSTFTKAELSCMFQ